MRTLKLRGHTTPDGLLRLEVPVGAGAGDVEVEVTVGDRPADPAALASDPEEILRRELELLHLAREWPRFESDLARALAAVTECAVRTLRTARASVWLLDPTRQSLLCQDAYDAVANAHDGSAVLARTTYPAYFDLLEKGDLVACDDAMRDPRVAEFVDLYLRPGRVGATLDAPIRVGGRCVGVLCTEHVGAPRRWTVPEQRDARYLAGLCSLALAVADRLHHEAELARSLSLLRATLDATADGILSVDLKGGVTGYNRRFIEMWGVPESVLSGEPDPQRFAIFAAKANDPQWMRARLRESLAEPGRESTMIVQMADGRIFESHGRPQWLGDRVVGRVWSCRDVTAQKHAEAALRDREARLEELATRDALTSLYNRRHTLERLEEEIQRSLRYGQVFTIAVLDLDHFKAVNDTYGHLVGDTVLRNFARELASRVRATDVVGRYGGEEFLILFLNAPREQARQVLADLRARSGSSDPHTPTCTFSGGLAEFPADGKTADALLDAADRRLYDAKHAGRDRVI
jgi:diguanylate cyclase (GGDEF)-like protein/PAS domain S-box-containing protein